MGWWMLQYMENMEASCVFYVKVGTLNHLERSKTYLLTVNTSGIVRLTVQHDFIVSVSLIYHPGDNLRQTSVDVLSLEQYPIYSWQSCDLCCHTLWFIPVNTQTTSDWLIAHLRAGKNPCNMHLNAAGFILSITNVLAASYSILPWSWLYNPQDFPLLFIIIFLFSSTPTNLGYTTTSARTERIQIQPIARRFVKYSSYRHTARMQTPIVPPWRCQCSHQIYDPGCTFKNRP
jgi:hypothetical protein